MNDSMNDSIGMDGGSLELWNEHAYSLVLLLLYWIIGHNISEVVGKVTLLGIMFLKFKGNSLWNRAL